LKKPSCRAGRGGAIGTPFADRIRAWGIASFSKGEPLELSDMTRDVPDTKESAARYRGLLKATPDAMVVVKQAGEIVWYRGLMEAAPDAMVVVNQAGEIVLLNVRAETQFGYHRDELLGQQVTNIIPEGFAERLIADDLRSAEEALAQQIGTGIELVGLRKDGSEFPIEIMLSPLRSDDGILVTAAIRDITVRKEADADLAQMESQYRGLLEAAPDAMVVVNQSGEIVLLNLQTEKRFGYSRDELLGRPVTSIIPEGFAERLLADQLRSTEEAIGQQMGSGIELTGQRKDGSEFPIEIMLSPLQSDDGLLVTAAIRDITVRKEESLRVERLKDEFVSTVSHELRTPLTSIAGSLALLIGNAAGPLPEPATRLLNIAHKNSQRLVRLINDILDIEKMESGQVAFDFKRVEVKSLVEQAIEANCGFADGFKVRLRLSPASVTANVRADPDRLMQVITNLLSNAIKFSPAHEEVLVAIEEQRGTVCISVRDHGYGIPDDFKSHIFEKFAQADGTDKRKKGGTGLGLSIVKSIVDRLGGEASFDEASGGGTIFRIDLPVWKQAIRAKERVSSKSNLSVLLCEDDPKAAIILCERLSKEGFLTDVAMTADEAIIKVATTSYAAILVDLQLPEGDGIDLIKRLRAQPEIYNTLLVMLSADPSRSSSKERPSTLLNILDWLDTPIDVDRLVRVLERPMARNGSARPHILHLDSDHDALRLVARALGETAVVMSVDSIDQARRALAANRFDVAVLDMALALGSGFDLLHDLRDAEGDAMPIVVFSPEEENPVVATQIRAALIKSRASIDFLVSTLRKRLATSAPDPEEKEVA
jgi:PAS domain S-box-containing protein